MLCRLCGNKSTTYLDLGRTPLANACLRKNQLSQPEYKQELKVTFCPTCSLSQLTKVTDSKRLYANYLYRSGTPQTFRDHCVELAESAIKRFPACGSVLDIASNDGTLLRAFQNLGIRVQGIDPARNLAKEANASGIPTLRDYWPSKKLTGTYDVITSTNVLAHVDDVHAFMEGVKARMSHHGMWVLEVPYVGDLIKNMAFDTIYHEHLSYFTLSAIKRLVEVHHGLDLFHVEHFPDLHGGTIRCWVSRGDRMADHKSVTAFLAMEKRRGLWGVDVYRKFSQRVKQSKRSAQDFLKGKRVWAYGAAAKGATLLNYYGLKAKDVPVAIDDNPKKWGLFMPGSHTRITGIYELKSGWPEYLLLLAWNFKDEIMKRCRDAGYEGKFIVPVPTMREVS